VAVTGETVTIASKLPFPLHLDLKDNDGEVRRVTLRGSGESRRADSNFEVFGDIGGRVIGGYGLTRGVSKDFWDAWEAQYRKAGYAPVVNNLIFALPKLDAASAKAHEMAEVRNGLEPIDPKKPWKSGKGKDSFTVEKLDKAA